MKIFKTEFFRIVVLFIFAIILRFFVVNFTGEYYSSWVRILSVIVILGAGSVYVLRGIAETIEKTTEILSEKTKLAGGLLQAFGTALPDMILGVVAAVISFKLRNTDITASINYAIIAAATTFGSNIYNIGHAAWCVFRQNLSNTKNMAIKMFPGFKFGGFLTPIAEHKVKPTLAEIDTAIDISNALTLLTATVAMGMVIFGRYSNPDVGISGDLHQLIRPIGFVVFVLAIGTLFYFRKSEREVQEHRAESEDNFYRGKNMSITWIALIVSAASILFTAEAMVKSIEVFCEITSVPFVVAGVLAGLIGCLGEMIVVHNFSVNPNGRIGDAIVGVAMDNIVTTIGASIVAMMGGIFLGGNALILIFVVILTLNSVLMWQISRLKNNFLLDYKNNK